jgi:hypothetical protein
MSYLIKASLTISAVQFYINANDRSTEPIIATNIRLCNTSGSAVIVYLSFYASEGGLENFEIGSVLFGYSLAANTVLDVPDRILQVNDIIEAYADTADVVSISMDIAGDEGRYEASV